MKHSILAPRNFGETHARLEFGFHSESQAAEKSLLRSLYYYLGYFFPPFGRRLQRQKVSIYSCYWAKNIPGTNLLLLIGLGL